MPHTVEYIWLGEVVLRCSVELMEEDNGTLIPELLKEQMQAAKWGGVSSPVVVLCNPPLEELV